MEKKISLVYSTDTDGHCTLPVYVIPNDTVLLVYTTNTDCLLLSCRAHNHHHRYIVRSMLHTLHFPISGKNSHVLCHATHSSLCTHTGATFIDGDITSTLVPGRLQECKLFFHFFFSSCISEAYQ